jgi:dTDP-4-dehydrorhamnose reductase
MRVLVLGDGLLGSEIEKKTKWDFLSRKSHGFDVNHFEKFIDSKYDVIVNCIANTDTYSDNKDLHWDVNLKFVDRIIDYCNFNSIKLVHISTDYIYTGSKSEASEADVPVHCPTWYGYTKLVADGLVQLRCKDYLLIRCSQKPYPFPYDHAWIDQIGNFDYSDKIADLIIQSIRLKLCGLYNIGTETKTMFDLASRTKNVKFSFSPPNVPKNISMDISKFKKEID